MKSLDDCMHYAEVQALHLQSLYTHRMYFIMLLYIYLNNV